MIRAFSKLLKCRAEAHIEQAGKADNLGRKLNGAPFGSDHYYDMLSPIACLRLALDTLFSHQENGAARATWAGSKANRFR